MGFELGLAFSNFFFLLLFFFFLWHKWIPLLIHCKKIIFKLQIHNLSRFSPTSTLHSSWTLMNTLAQGIIPSWKVLFSKFNWKFTPVSMISEPVWQGWGQGEAVTLLKNAMKLKLELRIFRHSECFPWNLEMVKVQRHSNMWKRDGLVQVKAIQPLTLTLLFSMQLSIQYTIISV
jgi:hypothetical protein